MEAPGERERRGEMTASSQLSLAVTVPLITGFQTECGGGRTLAFLNQRQKAALSNDASRAALLSANRASARRGAAGVCLADSLKATPNLKGAARSRTVLDTGDQPRE